MVDGDDFAPAGRRSSGSRPGSRGRARRATPRIVAGGRAEARRCSRRLPGRDIAGAVARQHVLVHPAFRAVDVADFPPGVELLDDLDRRAGASRRPRRTSYLVPGPTRTLIGVERVVTKRGSGRPLGFSAASARRRGQREDERARPAAAHGKQDRLRRSARDERLRATRTEHRLCRRDAFSYH